MENRTVFKTKSPLDTKTHYLDSQDGILQRLLPDKQGNQNELGTYEKPFVCRKKDDPLYFVYSMIIYASFGLNRFTYFKQVRQGTMCTFEIAALLGDGSNNQGFSEELLGDTELRRQFVSFCDSKPEKDETIALVYLDYRVYIRRVKNLL